MIYKGELKLVDFAKKIQFLHNNLYNDQSYTQLTIALLASSPTSENIRRHKASVKKWIDGKVKSPTMFQKNYDKYPLAKLRFKNGHQLFPLSAFANWSYERFVKQYENYQEDKKSNHTSLEDYKYIYYYHEDVRKLAYFEIKYHPNETIEITTNHHAQIMNYKGEIIRHQESSIIHFVVENDAEMMFFSFDELDLQINFALYGICLCKDFVSKNPKSSLVLLSNNILTIPKEALFRTKLNNSNITIADNNRRTEEHSFIDNLSIHLRALKDNQNNYQSNNIFLNLFLNEFTLFYNKFDNFLNQFQFDLTSFSRSIQNILVILEKINHTEEIKIVYTLKEVNKSLFNPIDDESKKMYEYFIELSRSNKFSFEFIIILDNKVILDSTLKEQFKIFEESGITLFFRDYNKVAAYATIAFVHSYDLFALYSLKGDKEYTITQYSPEVKKLKKEYEIQKIHAKTLQNILDRDNVLDGKHYFYGYGSNHTLHLTTLAIDGKSVTLKFYNKKYVGEIHFLYGDILICSELGFIKFKEKDKNKIIKTVSFVSEQYHGNGESIILFGILSRYLLEKDEVKSILSALIDRDTSSYNQASFKESPLIHEVLKPLRFKYENIN